MPSNKYSTLKHSEEVNEVINKFISLCRLISSEEFVAHGHINIRATHKSTFEITKENYVTKRGDCIIGINASKSLAEFNENFKNGAKNPQATMIIIFKTKNNADFAICRGNEKLTFNSSTKLIVRKSSYVDGNTLCINSNKSAGELNRNLIEDLKDGLDVVIRIYLFLC